MSVDIQHFCDSFPLTSWLDVKLKNYTENTQRARNMMNDFRLIT